MKVTVGTDIIETERVKEAMLDVNFAGRVFTKKEIEYCENKKAMKYQHYAARFAAKEAVFKAISPMLKSKYSISWTNIEISNDENGRPYATLLGIEIKNIVIDISVSHIKDLAIAMVAVTEE